MRLIFTFLFAALLLLIICFGYKKTNDLFSPMVFYCILTGLRYIPGILSFDQHMGINIDEKLVEYVFVFQTIAVLSTLIGYLIGNRVSIKSSKNDCLVMYDNKISLEKFGYILFVIGAFFGIVFLRNAGGISLILSSIKRLNVGNGNSYIRSLTFLMIIGICFVIKGRNDRGKKAVSLSVILMYLFYSFIFIIQTSRSPVLEALMIIIMLYHYDIKKIELKDIIKPKSIILILLIIIFVIIMPMFRTDTGFNNINLSNLLQGVKSNFSGFFEELSYVGRDGFIYKNYDSERYWHGSNIINLLYAPIPSSLIKGKPPVDDGIYLANAVIGRFIKPPATLDKLPWYNSYPMSTPGGMYINFGIFGLILGSVFMGFVYSKTYNKLKKNNFDVVNIIIYQLVIYQLELTSLSIVQMLMPLVITLVFSKLICGRKVFCNNIQNKGDYGKI